MGTKFPYEHTQPGNLAALHMGPVKGALDSALGPIRGDQVGGQHDPYKCCINIQCACILCFICVSLVCL